MKVAGKGGLHFQYRYTPKFVGINRKSLCSAIRKKKTTKGYGISESIIHIIPLIATFDRQLSALYNQVCLAAFPFLKVHQLPGSVDGI